MLANPTVSGRWVNGDETSVYTFNPETKQHACRSSTARPVLKRAQCSEANTRRFRGRESSRVNCALDTQRGHANGFVHAPARRTHQTKNFLAKNQVQQLSHPLYGPHSALGVFFRVSTSEVAVARHPLRLTRRGCGSFHRGTRGMAASESASCFSEWLERMTRCIGALGESTVRNSHTFIDF